MATKLHSTLTGSDLHVNKIDGTTGTELTTPSETIYDLRWVKRTGSSITVPNGGNLVGLAVNQNDTTNNPAAMTVTVTATSPAIFATCLQDQNWLTGYVGGTQYFGLRKQSDHVEVQSFTSTPLALNPQGNNVGVGTTVANSVLQVARPISKAITTSAKTTTYTITASDSTVTGDTTSGAFTITLPTAVGIAGRIYTIKRISASANNLTVGTTSSQTIDGATTKTLGAQYSTLTVQSNGSNWVILSTLGTVT